MRDSIITWVDNCVAVIEVPIRTPHCIRERKQKQHIGEFRGTSAHENTSNVETQILELIQNGIHPTVYRTKIGVEDVTDACIGIRFNFRDRSEVCYTGTQHYGNNNFKAWVDDSNDAWMRCFSTNCCSKPPFYLGNVRDDTVNKIVDQWLDGRFKALCLRSPMGSGKTTLLTSLLDEVSPTDTAAVITYRQTLAYNLASKLPGFYNYLDGDDLSDRRRYPRVICQLDSLAKLSSDLTVLPRFDFVVLDEVESLLNHFSSSTLKGPVNLMTTFVYLLKHAKNIIVMDALWGRQTNEFLDTCNISFRLIINTRKAMSRKFEFITEQRRNLLTASLSTNKCRSCSGSIEKYEKAFP